jgi:hypothetical protein
VIHLVDQMLESFLRAAVPLPESSVDISFATPDRKWGAGVTRPTVNLFLWDIKRSFARATTGVAELDQDGRVSRRPQAPILDLRYFVSAWAAEGRDEHRLLGSLLRAVVITPCIPEEVVPEQLASGAPTTLELAASSDAKSSEFWSSLDGQLKPGLDLRLGVDIDAFAWEPTAEAAAVIDVGLARTEEPPRADGWTRDGKVVGGPVRAAPRARVRRNGRLVEEPRREPAAGSADAES